VTNIFVKTIL